MSSMGTPTDEDLKSMDARTPYAHKVAIPPRQNLFKEFQDTLKETFFADDPLRSFKDQPKSRKLILGIEAIFPILNWGRNYNLKKFRGDIIAGLTIASLCIPQDIGYSKLAHLAPQYGLYSSFVPPLIYACMGSSRDIAIGPVAVVSLLLGTLLGNEIDPRDVVFLVSAACSGKSWLGSDRQALRIQFCYHNRRGQDLPHCCGGCCILLSKAHCGSVKILYFPPLGEKFGM